MFLLFDSNVWISQLGLQSANGAAVRCLAMRRDAVLAIPEIVEIEVSERLAERLLDARSKIERGFGVLLPVLGKLGTGNIPTEEQIRESVANVIPDIDVPVRRMEFNLDASRSSLRKILKRIPPSRTKEQFRDGVIWANCLELLGDGDVYFVSDDRDFYMDRKYCGGLAAELIEEVKEQPGTSQVKLFRNLTELLEEIRQPIDVDKMEVFRFAREEGSEDIDDILSGNGFATDGSADGNVACFATENADEVYFTFEFRQRCVDSTDAGRRSAVLKLEGSGSLNPVTKDISRIRVSQIRLDYPDWESGGPRRGALFASASLNGSKVHQIRFQLD